jgi:hypothetical protein
LASQNGLLQVRVNREQLILYEVMCKQMYLGAMPAEVEEQYVSRLSSLN